WKRGKLETVHPQSIARVNDGWEIDTQANELYLVAPPAQWNPALSTLQELFEGNYTNGASEIPASSAEREPQM
ncbi:MAG TPA: hypothetical protein PK360_20400, partial [bacterium]|nr:hypothetical protein [bacterium]